MPKQIVNLTQLMARREIDKILSTEPYNSYHNIFQDPDLRNRLLLYVLKRISNNYIVADSTQPELLRNTVFLSSLKQHRKIKSLIYQSIYQVLPEDTREPIYYIPQADASTLYSQQTTE